MSVRLHMGIIRHIIFAFCLSAGFNLICLGQARDYSRADTIAASSACAKHSWDGRGKAPIGYIKGLSRVYYDLINPNISDKELLAVITRPLASGQDGLVVYKPDMIAVGADLKSSHDLLRSLFTLAFGEGMRESSGNTTEGRDITAKIPPSADTAEAGLFQQSYDSFSKSALFPDLYKHFKEDGSGCMLPVFKEGIRHEVTISPYGTGPGAAFQRFTRACPAFATRYAVILMRVNQRHFGPVRRHEAEFYEPCYRMLQSLEKDS